MDGRPGAITSVGLKSGTNQIHGTAYAFGRSDSFDARNYFNHSTLTAPAKTPVELEQFGGSARRKNHHATNFFILAAFEAQRYTVGNRS